MRQNSCFCRKNLLPGLGVQRCGLSYVWTSYVRISEITDVISCFRNFGPKYEYVKYVRVSTQAYLIIYLHSLQV